jgi:hypothetical protein
MEKIKYKLVKCVDEKSGTSKAGKDWKSITAVFTTVGDKFERTIAIDFFGDGDVSRIKNTSVGTIIDIDYNVESREYNGKYYTNVKAWRFTPESAEANRQANAQASRVATAADATKAVVDTIDGGDDSLPF